MLTLSKCIEDKREDEVGQEHHIELVVAGANAAKVTAFPSLIVFIPLSRLKKDNKARP